MKLFSEWITRFSDKELQAPFVVSTDLEYYNDLRKRLTHFVNQLEKASADDESIRIARKYSDRVCEAIRKYYKGEIGSCHQKIENLVKGCDNHILAIADLKHSRAFLGSSGSEIQFFRARTISEAKRLKLTDMLHQPFNLRANSGSYRFSIPGVISLYLSNTSYGCWIEMGKPSEHDFYVSPIVLDGSQRIFNLAVMTRLQNYLNDWEESFVHCWIKLLVLMIASSYKVEEKGRSFHSEYIVSQAIMLACKKLGYDGVAYYSKQADEERFSLVAVNLALFTDFEKDKKFGKICKHLKIDEPLNYQLFRQLNTAATYKRYRLRVVQTGVITNINGYKRQYKYSETEFYRFDEHLFGRWDDKETLEWGHVLKDPES